MLGTHLFPHPYLHLVRVSTFDWILTFLKGSTTYTWRCWNPINCWHTTKVCIWVWEGCIPSITLKLLLKKWYKDCFIKKNSSYFLNIRKPPNIKIYTYFHYMWSLWIDNHIRFIVKRKNTYIWCFKISSP